MKIRDLSVVICYISALAQNLAHKRLSKEEGREGNLLQPSPLSSGVTHSSSSGNKPQSQVPGVDEHTRPAQGSLRAQVELKSIGLLI